MPVSQGRMKGKTETPALLSLAHRPLQPSMPSNLGTSLPRMSSASGCLQGCCALPCSQGPSCWQTTPLPWQMPGASWALRNQS